RDKLGVEEEAEVEQRGTAEEEAGPVSQVSRREEQAVIPNQARSAEATFAAASTHAWEQDLPTEQAYRRTQETATSSLETSEAAGSLVQ
ncbi:MAG TPA: hypothetical protein VI816_04780, partial [Candidatus Bathyarchaeia archaeon]|nr:hypothetical protein [Candidatus Bathyarchaeia archaeon]